MSMSKFFRVLILSGEVKVLSPEFVRDIQRQVRGVGRNINQIARLAHISGKVSKETLLLKIWGNDGEAVDNNVEIYISFLRKKLDFLGAKTAILTARHLGYYLSEGGRP